MITDDMTDLRKAVTRCLGVLDEADRLHAVLQADAMRFLVEFGSDQGLGDWLARTHAEIVEMRQVMDDYQACFTEWERAGVLNERLAEHAQQREAMQLGVLAAELEFRIAQSRMERARTMEHLWVTTHGEGDEGEAA